MIKIVAQIQGPAFSLCLFLHDDKVEQVPPGWEYMLGWPRDKLRRYCQIKKWQIIKVNETETT